MAGKTNLSATLFSQKKLLGKSSTGTHRADSNEPIPSGVQVAASTVFAETIPSTPHTTMFEVQSASDGGPSTVEYVEFALEQVTGSTYDANSFDSDAAAQASGVHAYRLVLTSTYDTNSNNLKKGSFPYKSSQILHWTLGGLQLIGPQFSNDVPNPYNLTIYSGSRDVDDQIPLLDEIDWQIDYYSGILLVQDYDASKIPTRAKGYIYVGKMLSASLGELSSSSGTSTSGKDVGWFQSGNGSISTTGSLYIGTSNTSNPEIYFSSVGAAIFNEQGRDVDFRIESSNKANAFTVDAGTDQVLILSGGGGKSYNEASGGDVNFYVSGSVDSRDSSTRGTSVFGGDVVVSGTLSINRAQAGVGSFVTVTSDGKVGIGSDTPAYKLSVGGNMDVGEYIYHKNDANTYIRFQDDDINIQVGGRSMLKMREEASIDQVLIMSGGAGTSINPKNFLDTNFFVSGAIGSRGTSDPGTAVFGGDVIVSGTLYDGSGAEISSGGGTGTVTSGTFIEPASGHLVQTGSVSLAGEKGFAYKTSDVGADTFFFVSGTTHSRGTTVRGAAVFGGDVISSGTYHTSDILPLSDNTYDLGSPTARYANIYTGDLHLRNERGHWQLIEERDFLTVTNKITGKRYKIVLEPYEEDNL